MASEWSFAIENEAEFSRQLGRLGELTSDFRVPLSIIAMDFYRSQRKIFTLQGPGKYQDLSEDYKKQKQKEVGFVYPVLFKRGRLAGSLLSSRHPDSEFYLGKQELIMGTSVPYAIYHQSDAPRSRLPQRKVVFIDGGPLDEARDGKNGRRDRWGNIIFNYIKQILNKEV